MAEQVGMGMQALLATAPELGARYKSDLDAVFATLKSAKSFGPEAFSEAAGRLNGRMGK
jgi:hypothetical protein